MTFHCACNLDERDCGYPNCHTGKIEKKKSVNYIARKKLEWIHPDDQAPPLGTKLMLLTSTGIQILGHWQQGCVAWSPLLAVSKKLKKRIGL